MTTRAQIIAAAKEAGIHDNWNSADWYSVSPLQLEQFYKIAFLAGFKSGKKAERALSIIRSEVD